MREQYQCDDNEYHVSVNLSNGGTRVLPLLKNNISPLQLGILNMALLCYTQATLVDIFKNIVKLNLLRKISCQQSTHQKLYISKTTP